MNIKLKQRYEAVTDGNENSVFDHEKKYDLFPTKSGNRDYQSKKCRKEDAAHIANCLNFWQTVHGDQRAK